MNKEVELLTLTLDTDINVNKTKVQCSIKTSRKIKKEQRKQLYIKALITFLVISLIIAIIVIIQLKISLKKEPSENKVTKPKSKSTILNTMEEYDVKSNIISNRFCDLNLIYQATVDGDSYKTFLEKVRGIYPILVLFQTEEGEKFGAYLNQELNQGKYSLEYDADVFSVDNLVSYYIVDKFYQVDEGKFLYMSNYIMINEFCVSKRIESEVKIEIAKDGEKRPTDKVYIKEIEVLQILNKGIK